VHHNRFREWSRAVERFADCLVNFDVAEVSRPIIAVFVLRVLSRPRYRAKRGLGEIEPDATIGQRGGW
jgi:hypothetical protein